MPDSGTKLLRLPALAPLSALAAIVLITGCTPQVTPMGPSDLVAGGDRGSVVLSGARRADFGAEWDRRDASLAVGAALDSRLLNLSLARSIDRQSTSSGRVRTNSYTTVRSIQIFR